MSRPLSELLPGLIIGGGVFNIQMNDDPLKLPIIDIMEKAFSIGMNAVDTSPYYGPSEELIGQALRNPRIKDRFKRSEYILMTKAGRVALNKFDYSPNGVRASVQRSLDRLDTTYLDCLYLHDVEFVTETEVLEAIEVLFELKEKGIILNVGISAYPPEVLTKYIESIKSKYGKVPDVVQNYAHFTIQNTTVNNHLDHWRSLGVNCIVNSSPLNMGLLSGKPAAAFHPAPTGLRNAALTAAKYCADQNMSLADIALKFVVGKWNAESTRNGGGFLISGISFVEELEKLVKVYSELLIKPGTANASVKIGNRWELNTANLAKYEPIFAKVRSAFDAYLDYAWVSPPEDFKRE